MTVILKHHASAAAELPFGVRWTERLVTFVAVPLLLGFVFGWVRAGRAHEWPLPTSLAFWLTMSLLMWLMLDLGSRIAERLLRRWRPRLIVVLVVGALIGVFLMFNIAKLVIVTYQDMFVPRALQRPLQSSALAYVVHNYLVGVILWVLTNLALVHRLGARRFGFGGPPRPAAEPPRSAEPAIPTQPAPPAFLDRIERPVGRLLAIRAEQHYLRVIGSDGDGLILYRISDAVRELAGGRTGLQVHRSYWIAREAVTGVVRGRSGPMLVLSNGLQVPVGRTFRSVAAEAGLLDQRLALPDNAAEPAADLGWDSERPPAGGHALALARTGSSGAARGPSPSLPPSSSGH